jgi:uncharacterized protein (TIGR02147 family)
MVDSRALIRILQDAWTAARIRNPQFSLRAFARKLGVAPSVLSEILSGKRPITEKTARRLSQRLSLSPEESAQVFEVVSKKVDGSSGKKGQSLAYSEIEQDQFKAVSDWVHFAILSLSETKDFEASATWIGQRLGVSESVAQQSFDRLVRLGMLRKVRGHWRPRQARYTSSDEIVNSALKRAHVQHFQLAQKSLEELDLSVRDFIGITMAIDPSKLTEAKKRIREFRDELASCLEVGEQSEVYQLAIQLFPLTQLKKRED